MIWIPVLGIEKGDQDIMKDINLILVWEGTKDDTQYYFNERLEGTYNFIFVSSIYRRKIRPEATKYGGWDRI